MADTTTKNAAHTRAQGHFTASEVRDSAVKQEIERERAAVAAKSAKLRALRLAKEEADRAAAAEAALNAPPPAPKAKKPRRITVK
jgi:hypothetical protein